MLGTNAWVKQVKETRLAPHGAKLVKKLKFKNPFILWKINNIDVNNKNYFFPTKYFLHFFLAIESGL